MSSLFSDHVVLQQQTKVNIWGWATPGNKVQVAGTWGEQVSTVTGSDGKWKVKISTPVAGGPYSDLI
ncbi:hypothetical protein EZ449_19745 [Pedobacter frigidisoli]|uniref:Sialate O-acetylesterase n=1 Tax=Pedobacter frigidisoli TaxID=2530455 RepID=A0A4V2ML51_9SPHI|nr:hypothetical protein [Pedobacter frigidisoli]TCD00737.1 hypothetical protein EZ449_19745 [Pedobacter frigidisoli]